MVQEATPQQVAERKLARSTHAPSTVLVWTDGVRSGRVASCKSLSARGVRLRSHATETSKVDRLETLDHRRKQDHRIGAYPETRAEDVAERAVQAAGEVPDTIDSNKEAKCTRMTKETLLGARKALESSTQKAAIAHEGRKLAERAIAVAKSAFVDPGSRGGEPPDRVSQEQTTFGDAKENPSDLDTGVLEREAIGVVAVTSRFAASWSTRAQWSCLGFICGLARTASAGDEVIVNGYWFKRVSGATTEVVEATGPISTFRGECWSRRSSRRNDAGLACGHEQLQRVESADAAQRWGAVKHPKAGNREERASG